MIVSSVFLLITNFIAACYGSYTLDWKRCGATGDRNCFVPGVCVKTIWPDLEQLSQLAFFDQNCDVTFGIQTKFLSRTKMVMFIQMLGVNKMDTSDEPELGVYIDTRKLFGCSSDNGDIKLTADQDFLQKHPMTIYDVSQWEEKNVVCAVTIPRAVDLINSFTAAERRKQLKLVYIENKKDGTITKEVLTRNSVDNVFKIEKPTCEPDDIAESAEVPGLHVLLIPDKARHELDCKGIKSFTYKFYAQEEGKAVEQIDKVKCVEASNGDFMWNIEKNAVDTVVSDPEKHIFYCAVEMNKICVRPVCTGDNCPQFTKGSDSSPALLTCPGGKWFINGEYFVRSQTICKNAETKRNEAAFYIKYPAGHEGLLPSDATCFDKYDCMKKSRVDFSNCVSEECGILKRDNETVTCDSGELVHVLVRSTNTIMNATKYTCDTSDGLWKDEKGIDIPEGSYVYCDGKLHESEEQINTAILACGSIVILIVIISIGILSGYLFCALYRKFSREIITGGSMIWKKKNDDERIRESKKKFDKIPSTARITEGFKLIETFIDADEHHPEVWEPALHFLARFEGTVMQSKYSMHEKYTSYCYAKAEQISQKYGWRTLTPITKNNHDGYIRAIAIFFLRRSLLAKDNRRAKQLLGEAFFELKLDLVTQYPLCGLVLSIVTATHLNNFISTDGTNSRFDFEHLTRRLKDIEILSKTFPDMDYLRQHGSIFEQVRTARLQSLNHSEIRKKFHEETLTDRQAVELFFRAYNDKMYTTPEKILFQVFREPETPPKDSKKPIEPDEMLSLKKIIPEPLFTQIITEAIEKMIWRGTGIDAKKLQMRLQLETLVDKITEFKANQRLYEEILEEEDEQLQKWFEKKIVLHEMKTAKEEAKGNTGVQPLSNEKPAIKYEFPERFDRKKVEPWHSTRGRQCLASPDQQAAYKKRLDEIFSEDHRFGQRVFFEQEEMMEVLQNVRDLITTEPMLIEDVPNDTFIVGDIHGEIYDLYRILKCVTDKYATGQKVYEYGRYLFLGDYVDRGHNSLEVVMALFMLKILYPDRFLILRGNHEFFAVNSEHTFLNELLIRYGKEVGKAFHNSFNTAFAFLSVAAIVGDECFCAHAGFSKEMFTRSELLAIPKPLFHFEDDSTVMDIVWSDPMDRLPGTIFNDDRGLSFFYGEDPLVFALRKVGCLMMIRGHVVINKGFQSLWKGRSITVYSSTGSGEKNNGTFIHKGDNEITTFTIKYDEKHRQFLRELKESDKKQEEKRRSDEKKRIEKEKREKEKEKEEEEEEEEEEEDDGVTRVEKHRGRIAVFDQNEEH